MSVFKKGDLVVTLGGFAFKVDRITENDRGRCVLWAVDGHFNYAIDCRHLKPLDDTKEIQLVDKPKPPVFDPSRCDIDLCSIDVVAMDRDGSWYAYSVFPDGGGFDWCHMFLYQDTPSPLWRETKTYIGGNK